MAIRHSFTTVLNVVVLSGTLFLNHAFGHTKEELSRESTADPVESGKVLSYPNYGSTEYLAALEESRSIFGPERTIQRSRLMRINKDVVAEFLRASREGHLRLKFELPIFEDVVCTIIGTKSVRETADQTGWAIVPTCAEGRYLQIGIETESKKMSVHLDEGPSRYIIFSLQHGYVAAYELDRSR